MIVIVLSKCPPALRGDLTKWLFEVSTNVFVGRLTARVRDELWDRILIYCKDGRATMVYETDNEQRMESRVHNTGWQPTDFDGIWMMMKPVKGASSSLQN